MKIQKKKIFFWGGGGRGGVGLGGQGGCERRSKVFVKIQKLKKKIEGGWVGVGWRSGGPIRGWGGGAGVGEVGVARFGVGG